MPLLILALAEGDLTTLAGAEGLDADHAFVGVPLLQLPSCCWAIAPDRLIHGHDEDGLHGATTGPAHLGGDGLCGGADVLGEA